MKNLQLAGIILLLPFVLVAYYARSMWTTFLAMLASIGLSTCRAADGNPTPATNSTQPAPKVAPPQVLCYRQPAPKPVFTNDNWDSSPEMKEWAEAERSVRWYVAGGERKEFEPLGKRIDTANSAYAAAKAAVEQGLLSQGSYDMAGKVLSEWHRDLALNYTSIKCYESVMINPEVEDINGRLMALERSVLAGNVSADAKAQAEAGIRKSASSSLKPAEAKELASLLMQLLDF
jgi:hypothetical protein